MSYYQFSDDHGNGYGSCEVFYVNNDLESALCEDDSECSPGWYWQACFPGCLPDGDPMGPFDTEQEAMEDAGVTE